VARDAGVTVQTVIRRFGGKEGLLDAAKTRLGQEIMRTRDVPRGDVAATARALVEDYESSGDVVMRALAQEDRYPAMKRLTDFGRAWHRRWLAEAFAAWLDPLTPEAAQRRLDALVVATDVYVWKLVRRDMRRPPQEYRVLVEALIASALAEPAADPGAPQ
jgi:AcrR family transcriptional regulator